MIFPNTSATNNLNSAIPQFINPVISLPFAYTGAQINYRDSTWLKLGVCELYLRNECPNIDNCSLAHPPNTVKIENNTVTVCYDYIKKRDCKHGNCKYYHPHDALSNAILRRGDDSKKNGANNIGAVTVGIRNPLQINRSHEALNLPAQNILSSQLNGNIIAEQMKNKMEVMRQLNAANASAWLPGLNVANVPTLVNSVNQTNMALHPLLPGVSASRSPTTALLNQVVSKQNLIATKIIPAANETDTKVSYKRFAYEAFGSDPANSNMPASRDNNGTGVSDVKKLKQDKVENTLENIVPQYQLPVTAVANTTNQAAIAGLSAPAVNSPYNLLSTTQIPQTSVPAYSQLGTVNMNNLLLQSLAGGSQKLYQIPGTWGVTNPLFQQLYYQQYLQNQLASTTGLLGYSNAVNIVELQQRALEETSVAFINDKGAILETLPVCKDFLQGKCKRSQSCNYVHLLDANVEVKDSKLTVCKNALKGQCHRQVCKFYHIPTYQLQKLGLSNLQIH